MATKIKGGGARKYDRNRMSCKSYRDAAKAERSKAKRLLAHIERCPWDQCARAAFERLPVLVRGKRELPKPQRSPAQIRAANGVTFTSEQRRQFAT